MTIEKIFTPKWELPEGGVVMCDLEDELWKHYIMLALNRTNGNKTRAAELLGMGRTKLNWKMLKLGLRTTSGRGH